MGRRAFERMLADERTQQPVQSVRCECGAKTDYIRQRKATLRTVLGKVTYQRAYYVCAAYRKGTYPLDERLGLRPNR